MKKMKQGLVGLLKRRKCKLRNHIYSREEVRKIKKPHMNQDKKQVQMKTTLTTKVKQS
jgi:hypothetical protein